MFDQSQTSIPSITSSRAHGMNSKNQIVGEYFRSGIGTRPFIWLPEPDYGLECGMHDLNVELGIVTDPGAAETSLAHAVNDAGVVAGVYDDQAFVWDLSTGQTIDISTQASFTVNNSVAYDVNNATPARVVGRVEIDEPCPDDASVTIDVDRAFEYVLNGSVQILEYVPVASDPMWIPKTSARGISPAPTGTPYIVGMHAYDEYKSADGPCDSQPLYQVECPAPAERSDRFAAQWTTGITDLIGIVPADHPRHEHWGYDVNDDGNTVGWGIECPEEPSGPFDFRERATFWESSTSQPDVLKTVPLEDDPAWANAVTNGLGDGELAAVGRNPVADIALFWHRESSQSQWSAADLNDYLSETPSCAQSSEWTLLEATDITDDLAICGWGDRDGQSGLRAFLMVAVEQTASCEADLNQDGRVDGADLGILNTNWGPCADCSDCCGDLTGSCNVGGDDLGILLSQWGMCPGLDECGDAESAPDQETVEAAEQGDYMPLFLWLMSEGYDDAAFDLANTTGLME